MKREKSFEKKEEEEDDASSGDESGRRSGEKENDSDADDSDADDSDDDFGDFRSRATSERRQSVLEKGRLFNDFQSKRVSSVFFFFFFFFFIVCAKLCVFESGARDDARDNNSEGRKTGERKSAGVVDAESFE